MQEPSQSGPPLLVPASADGAQRATVTLDSYSYTPNHLIVEARKPVVLTLTSVTTMIPHNFIIKDPAGNLSVEQDVSAGKTVIITFTPAQPGTFPIYCDKRLWPLLAIATKGWKGSLKCDKCGYEHRALEAGIAQRSPQASVPFLLSNKHPSWFRQMSAIKSASPTSVCPRRRYDCRHGIDRSSASAGFPWAT